MIDDATVADIRRLFFAEHWKVGTIARQLELHPDAVRRAVGSGAFNQRKAAPARPSVIDPFRPFVVETLARYPRLRATRLFEMVRARGYTGSVVQLRRYVATVRATPHAEAFLRRSTLPGEEGQVDWAHFGSITVGRAKRPLMCFVLVLGWSRAMYARFFHDQTTASFLCGHVGAFEALGGVPRRLLYDNLKSAVVERVGDAIRFGADLLELSAHYHFEPRACAPYRGNEKGKVERAIQYLRHAFFAARSFADIDDLNGQLADWIAQVAHRRLAPDDSERRTVAELLALERPKLLGLPGAAFSVERSLQLRSGKTPYLRVDLNDYSIPHTLVGQPLHVRVSQHAVRIFAPDGALAVEHARCFDAGQRVEDKAHTQALERHKRHARELRGRPDLVRQCPSAEGLLEALLARARPMGPEVRALLLLCERHGAAVVDGAIAHCLAEGLCTAQSVERRIDELRRHKGQPPVVAVTAPTAPRSPSIDLRAYDDLGARKDHRK